MPIYEYKCENGHVFEVIQPIVDEPLTACQECGAPAARVLSSPAVHFKGSGFYNTDYGKKKGGGNGSGSGEGSSESQGSDSGSSDSKSESKSEPKSDSKPAASTAD
jgi:putative FmdB family regulatory protein